MIRCIELHHFLDNRHGSLLWKGLIKASIIVLFAAVNTIYFKAIFGTPLHEIVFCCDATSYVAQSELVLTTGVLAKFDWLGYRSYFNYTFVAILGELGNLIGLHSEFIPKTPGSVVQAHSAPYAAGAFLWFFAAGFLTIVFFKQNTRFYLVFVSLFCNPFLFAFIPYPLQEGQAVLLLVPLVACTLLSFYEQKAVTTIILGSLFVGTGWMIKSYYIVVVGPAIIFLFAVIRNASWVGKPHLSQFAIMLSLIAIPVLPQVWSSLTHFRSLDPYPQRAFLSEQLEKGWRMWRYDTALDEATSQFRGLDFPSHFAKTNEPPFNFFQAVLDHPSRFAALAVGHLFGAFNFANMQQYAKPFRTPAFSITNLVVGMIIFTGINVAILAWVSRPFRLENILIDGIIVGNALILPFVAVETRFGVLSLAMLSFRAAMVILVVTNRREMILFVVGSVLFGTAFMLVGTLMFQTTGLPFDP